MKKLMIMVIPENGGKTRTLSIPLLLIHFGLALMLLTCGVSGYALLDYRALRGLRFQFRDLTAENEGLRGEARVLLQNLEDVKNSLRRVQDYSTKLGELTALKVQDFSRRTGIGPLSAEEFGAAHKNTSPGAASPGTTDYVPLGLNLDRLVFRTAFDRLATIGQDANSHALELQRLLSTLSQQKSLLASIPAAAPVDGWITSGFGPRISPFTGERSLHAGIDIAAPVGTPILAPADGVVIFAGAKEGFGNFVMIAHGYGLVTRYGHNHQNLVQPGQKVSRGEQIATVGESGRTTGPHVHYEVVHNGRTENPQKFILDLPDFNAIY